MRFDQSWKPETIYDRQKIEVMNDFNFDMELMAEEIIELRDDK